MAGSASTADAAAAESFSWRRGGWITFPFIIGAMGCLTVGSAGWAVNLMVYLIKKFNMKSIRAAQIFNFVNGSITMLPIVGAVVADSSSGGCFSVICFSALVSLLGILLLLLTAAIDGLRPPACGRGSSPCGHPSRLQLAVLYLGLGLASLGNAGTRFTIAPMGAHQFRSPCRQGTFFNWYIFTMYAATVVSSTAVVYIEDNVSWVWGFGLCAAANLLGLGVFLAGRRFYRPLKAHGSPFTGLARVVVGAVSKRRMELSENGDDYYCSHDDDPARTAAYKKPTHFFRFLNRAALRTETTDTPAPPRPRRKPCTVQEVENLKTLVKIFPLWSTGLLLCTLLAVQLSMSVLQALAMNRFVGGSHFQVPAGSMPVFILLSTSVSIFLIDRLILPLHTKITKTPLTLLRRVGIGHVLTVASMAVSALVESKRLRDGGSMSAMWLVPQMGVAGVGEAFHFPGQVALYYQEFPAELKSTSTAAVAMFIGIAFYVSNAVIDLVGKVTRWLPDDINEGRLDNVYWVCCAVGGLNFGYYVVCAVLYKYQTSE